MISGHHNNPTFGAVFVKVPTKGKLDYIKELEGFFRNREESHSLQGSLDGLDFTVLHFDRPNSGKRSKDLQQDRYMAYLINQGKNPEHPNLFEAWA